jgi:hypothetical protein
MAVPKDTSPDARARQITWSEAEIATAVAELLHETPLRSEPRPATSAKIAVMAIRPSSALPR